MNQPPRRHSNKPEFWRHKLTETPNPEPEFTRIRHRERQYFVIPPFQSDYEPVAVRIFRSVSALEIDLELNGRLIRLPWPVFEEGPQHPRFREVAEGVGIKLHPLLYSYWWLIVLSLKDDMDARHGLNWYPAGRSPYEDKFWNELGERERRLMLEMVRGFYPEEMFAYVERHLVVDALLHYLIGYLMQEAAEGRRLLFDHRLAA